MCSNYVFIFQSLKIILWQYNHKIKFVYVLSLLYHLHILCLYYLVYNFILLADSKFNRKELKIYKWDSNLSFSSFTSFNFNTNKIQTTSM